MDSTGSTMLAMSAGLLGRFGNAVNMIAQRLPPRVSMGQMAFFLLAGARDAAGRPATYSELREDLGPRGDSIKTTYAIFLQTSRTFPDALDWLWQEPNPDDRRQKHLRLTEKGEQVLRELTVSLNG
jgi:hypothetical protein